MEVAIMQNKFTKQEKFDMIIECRSSGLSDHMWCKQQGISPSTFYTWIQQLRKDGAQLPERSHADSYRYDPKPDVVKLEVANDSPDNATLPMALSGSSKNYSIEINIGSVDIRIANDVDSRLFKQLMSSLRGVL